MGLLQYTSNEMFSSTELVRKSKNIFDKLNKNEIEKAIILRDGKPGIILLDFNQYEKIINDYLSLKEKNINTVSLENKKQVPLKKEEQGIKTEEIEKSKDINDDDLKIALQKIENLEFTFDEQSAKEIKAEPLKEFWD
jgi:hypothetical protein